jgi:glycerol-3-phosphate dehydrogenase (NAD(P)+)
MTATHEPFDRCFVIGAGAWGTALAAHLARTGRQVHLWSRNENVVREIETHGENRSYLADIPLPDGIVATTERDAIADADAALCVVPAQHVREQLEAFAGITGDRELPLALCSKGIERGTGRLMHEVVRDVWPAAGTGVLSGPSFAADVARGLPTAVSFADTDRVRGARWQATLAGPAFRPYLTDDLVGAEIGGAIKNVLAIACGVVEGRGLGESARAALMARGFAEAIRFAEAYGGRADTLHGLSGLGDIILTCSSRQSRNMSLGYEIGRGRTADEVMGERATVAEGAATAGAVMALATARQVDMPIVRAVAALISGSSPVADVVNALLARPLRPETR